MAGPRGAAKASFSSPSASSIDRLMEDIKRTNERIYEFKKSSVVFRQENENIVSKKKENKAPPYEDSGPTLGIKRDDEMLSVLGTSPFSEEGEHQGFNIRRDEEIKISPITQHMGQVKETEGSVYGSERMDRTESASPEEHSSEMLDTNDNNNNNTHSNKRQIVAFKGINLEQHNDELFVANSQQVYGTGATRDVEEIPHLDTSLSPDSDIDQDDMDNYRSQIMPILDKTNRLSFLTESVTASHMPPSMVTSQSPHLSRLAESNVPFSGEELDGVSRFTASCNTDINHSIKNGDTTDDKHKQEQNVGGELLSTMSMTRSVDYSSRSHLGSTNVGNTHRVAELKSIINQIEEENQDLRRQLRRQNTINEELRASAGYKDTRIAELDSELKSLGNLLASQRAAGPPTKSSELEANTTAEGLKIDNRVYKKKNKILERNLQKVVNENSQMLAQNTECLNKIKALEERIDTMSIQLTKSTKYKKMVIGLANDLQRTQNALEELYNNYKRKEEQLAAQLQRERDLSRRLEEMKAFMRGVTNDIRDQVGLQ